jgi:hypothetical protein
MLDVECITESNVRNEFESETEAASRCVYESEGR